MIRALALHMRAALLAVASLGSTLAAEVVPANPSFEHVRDDGQPAAWSLQPTKPCNTAKIVNDQAHDGRNSLHLQATALGQPYADCLSDKFAVASDTPYVLEFRAHGSGAVFTHLYDEAGKQIDAPYWKFSARRWEKVRFEMRTPTGTSQISLRFRVYAPDGRAWIDSVSLRPRQPTPMRLPVPNPSVELADGQVHCKGWQLAPAVAENVAEVTDKASRHGQKSLHIKALAGHYSDDISERFPVSPNRPYVLSFDVRSPTGGCVFTHVLDQEGKPVPVREGKAGLYFPYRATEGDWDRQAVTFTAAPGAREMYLRFRAYATKGEAWFDGIQIDEDHATPFDEGPDVQLLIALPHHAWVRGTDARAEAICLNQGQAQVSARLRVTVTQSDRLFVRIEEPLAVAARGRATKAVVIPTGCLSCGRYEVVAALLRPGHAPLTSKTHLIVARPFRPTVRYGFYGYTIVGCAGHRMPGPAFTPTNIDAGLALLESASMNVFNATVRPERSFPYFLDEALARGIGFTPLLGLYFGSKADSEADHALDANLERIFVHTSKDRPDLSLLSACARRHASEGTRDTLAQVKDHPAFLKRFYFGDDVAMWRGKPNIYTGPIQDYSPAAVAAFKAKTGLDAPRMAREQLAERRGILPDDDPWLEWARFRCKDILADYQASIIAAKNEVCPEARGGPEHGCVWWPGIGAVPSYELKAADLLTYYAYPHYAPYHMFHCALALLGGRDKELWATPSAHNNIWGQWFEERTPEYERSCFFSVLAAGGKAVTFCPFQSRLQFSDGHPAVWREFRRLGTLVRRYGELMYAMRRKRQPLGLLISLSTSAYRVYDLRPRPYQFEDTHAHHVAATFYALLHAHQPVELVDEESILAADTKHYKAILLADVQVLPRSVADRLEAFVKRGGTVLVDDRCSVTVRGATPLAEHFDAHPADATPEQAGDAAQRAVTALGRFVPPVIDCDNPAVSVHDFDAAGVTYLFLVNLDVDRTQTARLRWPKGVHPYDVFASALLGHDPVEIEPGGGRLVALMPKRVGRVALSCPGRCVQTEPVAVTAQLLADDGKPMPGLTPVQVTLVDPTGRARREYAAYPVAHDGRVPVPLRFALNDEPGTWTVLARELLSGQNATARFELVPALVLRCAPQGQSQAAKEWRLSVVSNLSSTVQANLDVEFPDGIKVAAAPSGKLSLRPSEVSHITFRTTARDEFWAGPVAGEARVSFGRWVVAMPLFAVHALP